MNENLRRALLRAQLSEEDVAAHLRVDPKTVRRWLEGRRPYLRHRWAVAAMLGLDEAELWPRVGAIQSWPKEVQAVYPHRNAVPSEVWFRVFGLARREIDILDESGLFIAQNPGILAIVGERACSSVRVRICIPNLSQSDTQCQTQPKPPESRLCLELAKYRLSREYGDVTLRLHQNATQTSIYRADAEFILIQHVYGIPPAQAPVLRIRQTHSSDMATAYLQSFEAIWARSRAYQE